MKSQEPQIFINYRFNSDHRSIKKMKQSLQNSIGENEFLQKLRFKYSKNKKSGMSDLKDSFKNKFESKNIYRKIQQAKKQHEDKMLNEYQKNQQKYYKHIPQQELNQKQFNSQANKDIQFTSDSSVYIIEKNYNQERNIFNSKNNNKPKELNDDQELQNAVQINKKNGFKIISLKQSNLEQQHQSQIQKQKSQQFTTNQQYLTKSNYDSSSKNERKSISNISLQQEQQKNIDLNCQDKPIQIQEKQKRKIVLNIVKKKDEQKKVQICNQLSIPKLSFKIVRKNYNKIQDSNANLSQLSSISLSKQVTEQDNKNNLEIDITQDINKPKLNNIPIITEQVEIQKIQNMTTYKDLFEYFRNEKLKKGLVQIAFQKIFCLSLQNNNSVIFMNQNQNSQIKKKRRIIVLRKDNQNPQTQNTSKDKLIPKDKIIKRNFIINQQSKYSANFITIQHNPQVKIQVAGLFNNFHLNENDPRRNSQSFLKLLQRNK